MPQDLTGDKWTLVQVMAWCRQATSHTWTSVDQDLQRHMALLGPNELKLRITAPLFGRRFHIMTSS